MRRGVDSDYACPICGKRHHPATHCSERTYRGIDAAEARSDEPFWDDERLPYDDKLREGMELLQDDEVVPKRQTR